MWSRLTEAQLRELKRIDLYGSYNNLNYFVGESLRKRGLVERYTTYLIGADYADKAGVHQQFRGNHTHHEWFLTEGGRAALKEAGYERA